MRLSSVAKLDVDAEMVAGFDEVDDLLGKMMHVDDDMVNTDGFQFLDEDLHERLAVDGHHCFRHGVGKGFETSAETGCKDECVHGVEGLGLRVEG